MNEFLASLPGWAGAVLATCAVFFLMIGILKPAVAQQELAYNMTASQILQDYASFDLKQLKLSLRKTPAIGIWAKLTLKAELDAILEDVDRSRSDPRSHGFENLKNRFFALVDETASKLNAGDPGLSNRISSSRGEIWEALIER